MTSHTDIVLTIAAPACAAARYAIYLDAFAAAASPAALPAINAAAVAASRAHDAAIRAACAQARAAGRAAHYAPDYEADATARIIEIDDGAPYADPGHAAMLYSMRECLRAMVEYSSAARQARQDAELAATRQDRADALAWRMPECWQPTPDLAAARHAARVAIALATITTYDGYGVFDDRAEIDAAQDAAQDAAHRAIKAYTDAGLAAGEAAGLAAHPTPAALDAATEACRVLRYGREVSPDGSAALEMRRADANARAAYLYAAHYTATQQARPAYDAPRATRADFAILPPHAWPEAEQAACQQADAALADAKRDRATGPYGCVQDMMTRAARALDQYTAAAQMLGASYPYAVDPLALWHMVDQADAAAAYDAHADMYGISTYTDAIAACAYWTAAFFATATR